MRCRHVQFCHPYTFGFVSISRNYSPEAPYFLSFWSPIHLKICVFPNLKSQRSWSPSAAGPLHTQWRKPKCFPCASSKPPSPRPCWSCLKKFISHMMMMKIVMMMMMIMMIMIMKRRMKWRRSFLTNCVFLGLVTHIARQSHHLGQSIHTVLQLDQQIHNSRLVDFHKNWEHFKRSTHGLDHISPVLGEPRDRVHLPAVVDCHLASQILQCHHWKMHLQCLNSTWTSSEVKPDFSASLKECDVACCPYQTTIQPTMVTTSSSYSSPKPPLSSWSWLWSWSWSWWPWFS